MSDCSSSAGRLTGDPQGLLASQCRQSVSSRLSVKGCVSKNKMGIVRGRHLTDFVLCAHTGFSELFVFECMSACTRMCVYVSRKSEIHIGGFPDLLSALFRKINGGAAVEST